MRTVVGLHGFFVSYFSTTRVQSFSKEKLGNYSNFSCFLTRNYIIYCENNDMHISKASNWKDIFSLPQSVYDRFTDLTD